MRLCALLRFLTLAVFVPLSHCAVSWRRRRTSRWGGPPIGLEVVENTLYLYHLTTNDPPTRSCRRWGWGRSSTEDFLTWSHDEVDFLSDPSVSYFQGGMMRDTELDYLLALAGKKDCSTNSSGLTVLSATNYSQHSNDLPVLEPIAEPGDSTGAWALFRLNDKIFWVYTPSENQIRFWEITGISISGSISDLLGLKSTGRFDENSFLAYRAAQMVEVRKNVHLLSYSAKVNGSSEFAPYFMVMSLKTDYSEGLKRQRWSLINELDLGTSVQDFVFSKRGSEVFAVGWIRDYRERLSAKEAWRKGMTLVRKIKYRGYNDVIQEPVGLYRRTRSDSPFNSKKLVEQEKPLLGRTNFAFENEGTSVLNLTFVFPEPEESWRAGYVITLGKKLDSHVEITFICSSTQSVKLWEISFKALEKNGIKERVNTSIWVEKCSRSSDVLIIVGQDIIEVYFQGGRRVMTELYPVEKPFTDMTIEPLTNVTTSLKEASYRTFLLSGESAKKTVDEGAVLLKHGFSDTELDRRADLLDDGHSAVSAKKTVGEGAVLLKHGFSDTELDRQADLLDDGHSAVSAKKRVDEGAVLLKHGFLDTELDRRADLLDDSDFVVS